MSRCLVTAAPTNATVTGRSSHAPAPASDRGSPRASRGCPYPLLDFELPSLHYPDDRWHPRVSTSGTCQRRPVETPLANNVPYKTAGARLRSHRGACHAVRAHHEVAVSRGCKKAYRMPTMRDAVRTMV